MVKNLFYLKHFKITVSIIFLNILLKFYYIQNVYDKKCFHYQSIQHKKQSNTFHFQNWTISTVIQYKNCAKNIVLSVKTSSIHYETHAIIKDHLI